MAGKDWPDLVVPLAGLILNAAVTYGIISTQLQWIRADLDRQQRQIERIEGRIMREPAVVNLFDAESVNG